MIIMFDARTAGGISSKCPDYPRYLMHPASVPSAIFNCSAGIQEYALRRQRRLKNAF
jgi:hypothetical protein